MQTSHCKIIKLHEFVWNEQMERYLYMSDKHITFSNKESIYLTLQSKQGEKKNRIPRLLWECFTYFIDSHSKVFPPKKASRPSMGIRSPLELSAHRRGLPAATPSLPSYQRRWRSRWQKEIIVSLRRIKSKNDGKNSDWTRNVQRIFL